MLARRFPAALLALSLVAGCTPEPQHVASGPAPARRWYRAFPIEAAGGDRPAMLADPGGGLWVAVTGLADPSGRNRLFYRPPGGDFRLVHKGPFATEPSLCSVRAGEVFLGENRPLEAFRPTLLRVSAAGVAPLPAPEQRLDALEYLQMGGYAMLSDSDGFACGQRGSLFRLRDGRWSPETQVLPWKPGDPAAKSFCRSIRLDAPDRGFLADASGAGASWDGTAWRPIPRPRDAHLALLSPASGLAEDGASLARFDEHGFAPLTGSIPPGAPLVFNPAGRWAAHAGGLFAIEPRAVRALPGRLPFTPRALAEADGSLWALGPDGVYRATQRDVPTFAPAGPGAPAPGLLYAIALDLDQDGDLDLLGLRAPPDEPEGGAAALVAALNDGAGRFTQASLGLPDDVFLWRDHFDAGDVDGDGDVDVVTVSSRGRVDLWLQQGGRFARAWSREAPGATVALVDVDGDGDLDLSLIPATPALLLNDGAGHFSPGPPLPMPAEPVERVVWADVDGDGDVDALLQHWRDPAHLLLHTSAGFELVPLPVVAEGAAVASLSRDGRPEILAQKIHVRGVALPFERCRLDDRRCEPAEGPPVPAGLLVDLNLDGVEDVIATDLRGDETMTSDGEVHLGGSGGYERITAITGAMPRPVAFDADGDGDPDVYSPALGLRVNTANPPTFLRVSPRASRSDRLARGAVVVARRAGGGPAVASGRADHGVVTLGLPDADARYDVEVRFPAGERRTVTGLAAGSAITVRDRAGPAFTARLALLWAEGTLLRARPVRDLALPAALAAALAALGRRSPRRRAALPFFAAAWIALLGPLVRAPGARPFLLAPLALGAAALGQASVSLRARRKSARVAGPYELVEKLGAGAAATVWRARAGRREVALKLFPAEAMGSREARERFFREARVGGEIKHPNVVGIREAGELDDGRCFLAMELVRGRSLGELLRAEGRLPVATVVSVGLDVARALGALHEAGIVHRDVKPENVMVRDDGRAVLTDLGLARSVLFRTLTRHDVAVGTLAYMSPEQCVGRPLDGRSDLWSLGVTLYEALTGRRAFDGAHELELVYTIHNVDPAPPRALRPDAPRELEAALLGCLEREPEKRFASARELAEALAAAAPVASGERVIAAPASGTMPARRTSGAGRSSADNPRALLKLALSSLSTLERLAEAGPAPPDALRAFAREQFQRLLAVERALRDAAREAARPAPREGAPVDRVLRSVEEVSVAAEDDSIAVALGALLELTGAQRGFIALREPDGGLSFPAARAFGALDLSAPEAELSRTILAAALKKGGALVVDDAQADARFGAQGSVQALALRAVLVVPLAARGAPFGVLYLDNPSRAASFDEAARLAAESFARAAAPVLARDLELAELRRSRDARVAELRERHELGAIVGQSRAMADVLELVTKVAPRATTVLVTGETGTGKELVAEALHANSPRAGGPLVTVNCGALPAELVESELFGHERGAFTGAHAARVGRFEAASGGTLFLDEVGELPPAAQVKLLRVLERGTFERVGATRRQRGDVRVVAATNRSLDAEVAAGRFRADLLFRLKVIEVAPPAAPRPRGRRRAARAVLRRALPARARRARRAHPPRRPPRARVLPLARQRARAPERARARRHPVARRGARRRRAAARDRGLGARAPGRPGPQAGGARVQEALRRAGLRGGRGRPRRRGGAPRGEREVPLPAREGPRRRRRRLIAPRRFCTIAACGSRRSSTAAPSRSSTRATRARSGSRSAATAGPASSSGSASASRAPPASGSRSRSRTPATPRTPTPSTATARAPPTTASAGSACRRPSTARRSASRTRPPRTRSPTPTSRRTRGRGTRR